MNDEILRELARLLARLNEPDTKPPPSFAQKAWTVLNSTISITIIGGLLVGLATMLFQARISESASRVARAQAIRAEQVAVMAEFADGLDRWLGSSQGVVKRVIWLKQSQPSDTRLFPDGRSFTQTRDVLERMRAELDKLPQPLALCAKAKATFFKSIPLQKAVDLLNAKLKDYQRADAETYQQSLDFLEKQYLYTVELMGKELSNGEN